MLSYEDFENNMNMLISFRKEKEVREEHIDALFFGAIDDSGEGLFEAYCKLLSSLMGDTEEWISYFIWECNCGRNPQLATINGKKIKIKDTKTIYTLLKEENDRPNEL